MPFRSNPDLRFQFRLARDLGMTRADLLRRMSAREYAQWVAFYTVEAKDQAARIEQAKAGK